MKVLGHIHTLNDEDVIDRSLQGLLDQTHSLDEILIVDNGSTDSTLKRNFPPQVTVIRHKENLGTNGTLITGLNYALEQDYDWLWVFDADSLPETDALKVLLDFYDTLPPETQNQTAYLACIPLDNTDKQPRHGALFKSKGVTLAQPQPDKSYYECHVTIWSGILFRMKAINDIGLPSPDFVLDWGEFEYCYRIKEKGYKAFIHLDSILHHNIGVDGAALGMKEYRVGPLTYSSIKFPPIRCYYMVRNTTYFWIYQFKPRHVLTIIRNLSSTLRFAASFFLFPLGKNGKL